MSIIQETKKFNPQYINMIYGLFDNSFFHTKYNHLRGYQMREKNFEAP